MLERKLKICVELLIRKGVRCAFLTGVCLLIGCGSRQTNSPVAAESILSVANDGELLDGFEGQAHSLWAFDSADDEADASYSKTKKSQGAQALALTLRGKGRAGKIHLRREVEWDLSGAQALTVDVISPGQNFSIALAFKTNPDDAYQESKAMSLKQGMNRSVSIPLYGANWKNEASGWAFSGPPVNLEKVRRVMLLIFTGEESEGTIILDNLRVQGRAQDVYRAWRPRILGSTPLKNSEQFKPQEIDLVFRASYSQIFNRRDIEVGMKVKSPSGIVLQIPGFFKGLSPLVQKQTSKNVPPFPFWKPEEIEKTDDKSEQHNAKDSNSGANEKGGEGTGINDAPESPEKESRVRMPVWTVRFTPAEVGRYELQLWVRNRVGETRLGWQEMIVVPQNAKTASKGTRGGNVRVSRTDTRQFELQDGSPFFIFGQNVAWTTSWKPYLQKISKYGGNCCRIWLCPWGLQLERMTEPGVFDLATARRIDQLLADAEQEGVRIIFCFTFHGATASFWHKSPYAVSNGGPCSRPEEFFVNRKARKQFKRLMRYAISRWSASPALLAWEVINEAELARFERAEDVEKWVLEMARYLKQNDPHKHLVTVSVSRPSFRPGMWEDPNIDFISSHGYGKDVSNILGSHMGPRLNQRKPFLLAEFGGGWEPADDAADADGRRLQSMLWLTACSPSAGVALPWWWDTQIEARNLYHRFEALGRFLKGEDRRGRFGTWVRKPLTKTQDVEVHGGMDQQGARLYVFRPDWVRHLDARRGAMLADSEPLTIQGVLDGVYRVEYWDVETGKIFSKKDDEAKDAKLQVTLPAHAGPFAVKVDRASKAVLKLGR